MTAKGLQEETLRAMLEAGAVREVLVSRQDEKWTLAVRLGGVGRRWLPVCRADGHVQFHVELWRCCSTALITWN